MGPGFMPRGPVTPHPRLLRYRPTPGFTPRGFLVGPPTPPAPQPAQPAAQDSAGTQRLLGVQQRVRPAVHPPATPPQPAAQNSAGVQSVQRGPGVRGAARREGRADEFVPRNQREARLRQRNFWTLTLHAANRIRGHERRCLDRGRSRSSNSSRSRSPLPFAARNVNHLPLHHLRTSAGAVLRASDFECAPFPFDLRMFPMVDPPLAGAIVFVRETPLLHVQGVESRWDIPIGAVGRVLEKNASERQRRNWREFVVVRFFGNPDLPPRMWLHWYYFV
jgi:hypothetical protein